MRRSWPSLTTASVAWATAQGLGAIYGATASRADVLRLLCVSTSLLFCSRWPDPPRLGEGRCAVQMGGFVFVLWLPFTCIAPCCVRFVVAVVVVVVSLCLSVAPCLLLLVCVCVLVARRLDHGACPTRRSCGGVGVSLGRCICVYMCACGRPRPGFRCCSSF